MGRWSLKSSVKAPKLSAASTRSTPRRDLRQVALLLEDAFRQDLGALHSWSQVPVLRDVGAALLSTAFMPVSPENLRGFVYEENGRIIGNVTLTLDDGRRFRWLISNVAVAEEYRRRGIARQMMLAAVEEARIRGAQWIILNVRPWNLGAESLYESLGFEIVDTESHYVRTRARAYSYIPRCPFVASATTNSAPPTNSPAPA